jgi:hypothetical protein
MHVLPNISLLGLSRLSVTRVQGSILDVFCLQKIYRARRVRACCNIPQRSGPTNLSYVKLTLKSRFVMMQFFITVNIIKYYSNKIII